MTQKLQDFPGRMRAARLAKGWSQGTLATRAGVSERTVREIESGKRTPQQTTRLRLLETLGLPGDAAETRSEWPGDVQYELDIIGQALTQLTVEQRRESIARIIRMLPAGRPNGG